MRFVIRWELGNYGDNYEIVEAENHDEAEKMAYEKWREEAEEGADYECVGELTDELKEEHCLEDD